MEEEIIKREFRNFLGGVIKSLMNAEEYVGSCQSKNLGGCVLKQESDEIVRFCIKNVEKLQEYIKERL